MEIVVLIDDSLGNLPILKKYIISRNIQLIEIKNTSNLDVYKDFANKIVSNDKECKGIVFTTYGVDAFLVANKVKKSIAAFVTDEVTANLCIEHNNANVIIFPLYIISENYSIKLLDIVLNSTFQGSRHTKRINMLNNLC